MKRGPYKDRKELYIKAVALREEGYGYRTIAKMIGGIVSYTVISKWVKSIPVDKVKSYQLSKAYKDEKNPRNSISDWNTSKGRRNFLISKRGYMCERCNMTEWLGVPIPLELDHVNGNREDNTEENLKVICPNCHALTPTYKGKNIGKANNFKIKK